MLDLAELEWFFEHRVLDRLDKLLHFGAAYGTGHEKKTLLNVFESLAGDAKELHAVHVRHQDVADNEVELLALGQERERLSALMGDGSVLMILNIREIV